MNCLAKAERLLALAMAYTRLSKVAMALSCMIEGEKENRGLRYNPHTYDHTPTPHTYDHTPTPHTYDHTPTPHTYDHSYTHVHTSDLTRSHPIDVHQHTHPWNYTHICIPEEGGVLASHRRYKHHRQQRTLNVQTEAIPTPHNRKYVCLLRMCQFIDLVR